MSHIEDSEELESYSEISTHMLPALRSQAIQLSEEEDVMYSSQWYHYQEKRVAEILYKAVIPYIVYWSYKLSGYGIPTEDLVQQGSLGFMKALQSFDYHKHKRVTLYALPFIKGEMYQYAMQHYGIVKIATSRDHRKMFFQLKHLTDDQSSHGETPHIDAAAAEDMRTRLESRNWVSLDEVEELPVEEEADHMSHKAIEKVLPHLNYKERVVLETRMLSDEPVSLRDTAEFLGMSPEGVRVVERKVQGKIKKYATKYI